MKVFVWNKWADNIQFVISLLDWCNYALIYTKVQEDIIIINITGKI